MNAPSCEPLEPLEHLEQDVLQRIAAHRRSSTSRAALPISVVVTACALIVGLGVGVASAQRYHTVGAETVVLGDDAMLAPSSLLANGP